MKEELLKVRNLKFSWHPQAQAELLNINKFDVQAGECVFLHGPSGSGKSTFLNLISGVMAPTSGEISILGQSLPALSSGQRDQFRGDRLGFVFQMFNLLPYYSAYDNILLPLKFSKHKKQKYSSDAEIKEEIHRLTQNLNLDTEILNQKVNSLSVGQQQRVAVCRALLGRPELLIADEPTSALDAQSRKDFLSLLFSECRRHNLGLVFVSHDLELGELFDRSEALAELNQQ